ncbi:MAG: hypothetical protein Fur0037_08860 [Planctomycetota bacterium]
MVGEVDAAPEPLFASREEWFARAMTGGALGWTVRCTPFRRTVLAEVDGSFVFAKWRRGSTQDAEAEWRWLHTLPLLGFRVPRPLFFQRVGRVSVIGTEALAGRPLDVLWAEAFRLGRLGPAIEYAANVVAPMVRRLHDHGLAFRDLYWNHMVAEAMEPGAGEPALLDVERVMAPRLCFERWRVKDLAGLLASLPVRLRRVDLLRLLRGYQGGLARRWAALAIQIFAKARSISGHRPRYG